MELIIIIVLILINGLFSLAEMSLVSARKYKLENAIKKGSDGAKLALELSQNPSKLLSTVQIGITVIGILLGIYSGQTFTADLEQHISGFTLLQPYAHSIAVIVVVFCVTYVSIVLGELLPKRIGLAYPEAIGTALATPMKVISTLTAPFVWLLSSTNDILLKLFRIKSNFDSKVTEEEIKSMIQESTDGGEIREIEQDIVERVFEMGDRTVNSLMTHSTDIIWFDINDTSTIINSKIENEIHSAYPLCDGDLNDVKGVVLLKDLYLSKNRDSIDLTKLARKPILVAENTSAYMVLEKFKQEKFHYGIVVDEYGSTIGFLTMDDLLDALLGDVTEGHHNNEYSIEERDETSWYIHGQYSFFEFSRFFDLLEIEDEEFDFNTVGGLFLYKLNEVPKMGDKIEFQNYSLEIISMDLNRIEKILCKKLH
jgi:putative hemolysin